ncbi:methyl-accepting chemotaxis protein [Halomonas sp. LY9]
MNNRLHSISVKYSFAFISVAMALLVIFIADLLLVNSVQSRMVDFSQRFGPATAAVLNADRDLHQARIAEAEYVLVNPNSSEASALKSAFEENSQQAFNGMQRFKEIMQSYPETLDQLTHFDTLFEQWINISNTVFSTHYNGNLDLALQLHKGESLSAFNELRELYNSAGDAVAQISSATEATTTAQVKRQEIITGIFAVAVFLIAVFIALAGPITMSRAIRQVTMRIKDITEGEGDLTARIHNQRRDEIGELAQQFNAFIERIDGTLQSVSHSTVSLQHASTEIAKGSQELASRTEQAAANLQQTSASMEQIAAVVNNASESAQQANQLALTTRDIAQQGLTAMLSVEQTMDSISESSQQIGDIVSMIESIAFQTNILALNASVEAARAGEHGRGFAVVAQEVRTLASRASDASKSIALLIDTSVTRTQSGVTQVKQTGVTLQEMVKSIDRVADVVAEISAGAKEQSVGIGQVNDAVNELDSMTQHNASMVEESSAAAAELREQADRLSALVGSFKLSNSPSIVDSGRHVSLDQTNKSTLQLASTLPRNLVRQSTPEWESF